MTKVALIGAEPVARLTWAPYLGNRDDVNFLVFDPDEREAMTLAAEVGGTAFGNLDTMLDQSPEIVIVATWTETHKGVALDVLARCEGLKSLVIEAPLAMDVREAHAIIEAARKARVEVFVPFYQLLQVEALLALIAGGEYGAVTNLVYVHPQHDCSPYGGLRAEVGSRFFAFWKALAQWGPHGKVSAPHVHGTDSLLVAESRAVATTSWPHHRSDLPTPGQGRVVIVCERATIYFSLPGEKSEADPGYRVTVVPSEGEPHTLGDEYRVLSLAGACALQVERLLSGDGLPVTGARALSVQAHDDAARASDGLRGVWLAVQHVEGL